MACSLSALQVSGRAPSGSRAGERSGARGTATGAREKHMCSVAMSLLSSFISGKSSSLTPPHTTNSFRAALCAAHTANSPQIDPESILNSLTLPLVKSDSINTINDCSLMHADKLLPELWRTAADSSLCGCFEFKASTKRSLTQSKSLMFWNATG